MSELRPIRNIESLRRRPFWEVRRSIEILHRELGKNGAFNSAVQEAFGKFIDGEVTDSPIFFDVLLDDRTRESYEASMAFRPIEGASLIDAVGLKKEDKSLFLQYGRMTETGKPVSVAELEIGDQRYTGAEALRRIPEAFPRFYPAPKAQAA